MYATFEEFIDTHTLFGQPSCESASHRGVSPVPIVQQHVLSELARESGPRRSHRVSHRRRTRQHGGSALELAIPASTDTDMAASCTRTPISASAPAADAVSFHFATAATLNASKDDMSVGFRRAQHRCRYRKSRRRVDMGNPLLETISSIQDACESDDHEDSEQAMPSYGSGREHRLSGSRLFFSDADRDSSGYAGSNSIDSGYKSSCPTPEPSDGLMYGNEASSRGSIASQGSQHGQKPRIPMGTKVMNRHSHPRYAGRDLDHLMYLRQSILSAMQRYEQQAVVSCPSPGFWPRSSGGSPAPTCSSAPGSSPLPHRRSYMASYPSSRTHSPCYSSASNGSGMSSPGYPRSRLATAEEDIDSLLYGRVEELPGSYVTMIEDKYRRSSVARVKKLRDKNREARECSSSSDSSCPSPTRSPPSGRFSEVAKCMLEIIEDLQNQSQVGLPRISPSPFSSGVAPVDYHVYEEIASRGGGEAPRASGLEAGLEAGPPPPLPARPDTIFRAQHHRPKQRSNLYSLFQEASARRDISHSLEQEYRGGPAKRSDEPTQDEEYGFTLPT